MEGLKVQGKVSPVTRAVLRYFGGKWKVSPWILSHFPRHRVYVEPFGGGASVLMRKPKSFAEVYNDIDEEIVNVFRILRDKASSAELYRLLKVTPYSREEFYAAFDPAEDPIEQARRTLVKAYSGYGSDSIFRNKMTGFRSDTSRKGHIPAHDWATYPKMIGRFCERLEGVIIENRPALHIIKQYDSEETLFYVDPPYVHASRKDPAHGYRHEMSEQDHRDLSELLRSCRGMTILSGYRTALYEELYPGWKRLEKASPGQFSRDTAAECLWLSPNIPLRQGLLL